MPSVLALLLAALSMAVPSAAAASSGWSWPLTPRPAVVRPFVAPAYQYGPGHRGVDLESRVGALVHAPTEGQVLFTGSVAGRPVVTIGHPDGVRTTYEPVVSMRARGERVARGDVIGAIAAAPGGHCVPRACLHWGVLRDGRYVDPLSFLVRARIVLLPASADGAALRR